MEEPLYLFRAHDDDLRILSEEGTRIRRNYLQT
jgi:hypothetical protein